MRVDWKSNSMGCGAYLWAGFGHSEALVVCKNLATNPSFHFASMQGNGIPYFYNKI